MFKRLFELYNQGLSKITANFCSGYNIFHVIQIQWDIKVANDYIVETAKRAANVWIYSITEWARFSSMYRFFTKEIKKEFNIDLSVITKDVNSKEFEKLLKEWYAFWIWLKYAWLWWRGARKDQKVLIEEALKSKGSIYGHALTYFYSKVTKKFYIIDSLKSSRKPVEMSLIVFRTAVKNGIFFSNARSLYMKDRLLDKYLKTYRDWITIYGIENLPLKDRKAIERASRLRTFLK